MRKNADWVIGAGVALASVLSLTACVPVADVGGHVALQGENSRIDIGFNERQRDIIREYYARHERRYRDDDERDDEDEYRHGHGHGRGRGHGRGGLPPGLAKREHLPPGLERQIRRRGTLPPGLQTHRLPSALEARLPPPPENYVRVRVGTDIVLMNVHTHVVMDVVRDLGQM